MHRGLLRDAERKAKGRATVNKEQTMSTTTDPGSEPLRVPLSDGLGPMYPERDHDQSATNALQTAPRA